MKSFISNFKRIRFLPFVIVLAAITFSVPSVCCGQGQSGKSAQNQTTKSETQTKTEIDSEGEFRKLLDSAEQGDVNAQNNVGFYYGTGKGVPLDYVEALKWYRKAAEQGNAQAQNNVGLYYANGWGVPQAARF